MATVKAVCISEETGTRKHTVPEIVLKKDGGIVGDAHGDNPVRQISLLGEGSTAKMKEVLPTLAPGDFAENILVSEGITLYEIPVGTKLKVGEVTLEVTQIGKECHYGCEIRQLTGDCVMPREGIFGKVIEEGTVRPGDEVEVL
jgi:MOSC domain-containing protein YiiM